MTPPAALATAPGWFGKLASLGDFARRRLPEEIAAAFDAWLARGVAVSRAELGERWLDVYLTSPLWRFALAPGCVDTRWWFGVLMPSCDNVGRYFPLLVAQPDDGVPQDAAGWAGLEAWFAGIAEAALGTLRPNASVAEFEVALARVAFPPMGAPLVPVVALPHSDRTRHEFGAGIGLAAGLQGWVAARSLQGLRGCSLWSPLIAGVEGGSLSVAVGLPAGEAFCAMLEGRW